MDGPFSAVDLARRLGGEVEGDGSVQLVDVRALSDAGPEHLSFCVGRRYVRHLATTRAGAVLIDRETDSGGRTVIRTDDPRAAYAHALAFFHPYQRPAPGVDPRAWVAPDAVVKGATVEAFAWVGSGAEVGAGSWIEAGAYVGRGARIGRDCRLMANSVVGAGCRLGDRVWLNPSAIIGGEGFGFTPTPDGHLKIPQVGGVVVENDVEIGSNSCVDRASMGDTVIRRGAKLDNFVQVAHGAEVGEECLLVAYAGIGGSSRLGRRVTMAARSGTLDHVKIGDGVQMGMSSAVSSDQPPGAQLAGIPAIGRSRWLRAVAAFADLPQLLKRVRQLEARVAELEGRGGGEAAS